jgi:hypothetical protein
MEIGAPFNPYKVFQGAFAPFWLLEHPKLGSGAKLCYIRLLGFAGKDGRCYPSLETLGTSLGVSERQARDYVKELERAGLIRIEQRGLRKTNVYLFVWTAEMQRLVSSVLHSFDDPDDTNGPGSMNAIPERNNCSDQDRNCTSAPDRNFSSAQDRKASSVPIGINSEGKSSLESSSSSGSLPVVRRALKRTKKSILESRQAYSQTVEIILRWARQRSLKRLRSDRVMGFPDESLTIEWAEIIERARIKEEEAIYSVLDAARIGADRADCWRNWSFLTLQIQLVTERYHVRELSPNDRFIDEYVEEDADTEWAQIKELIRAEVGEIPFRNWFDGTRQAQRLGDEITITVPNEPTRTYLESEYAQLIERAMVSTGISCVRLIVNQQSLR